VTFDVQGPARLIGVDNGNPVCHESFQSSKRRVFNGLCLAIVQSTTTPGIVTVTATAQGLVEAHVTFEVC
jgi:beta-galactosidase